MKQVDVLDTDAQARIETERKEREAETVRKDTEAFKWVMSDKRGRHIVWQLLQLTGVFRNPYAGIDSETNMNCGKQLVGQHIFGLVNLHSADKYEQMMKESKL